MYNTVILVVGERKRYGANKEGNGRNHLTMCFKEANVQYKKVVSCDLLLNCHFGRIHTSGGKNERAPNNTVFEDSNEIFSGIRFVYVANTCAPNHRIHVSSTLSNEIIPYQNKGRVSQKRNKNHLLLTNILLDISSDIFVRENNTFFPKCLHHCLDRVLFISNKTITVIVFDIPISFTAISFIWKINKILK